MHWNMYTHTHICTKDRGQHVPFLQLMNDRVMSHDWVMAHTWMSHVTHVIEFWYTHDRFMFHAWLSHSTHMTGSRHTCLRSNCRIDESHHTRDCLPPHTWMSCYTRQCVISQTQMSHVTHIHELCHSYWLHDQWVFGPKFHIHTHQSPENFEQETCEFWKDP